MSKREAPFLRPMRWPPPGWVGPHFRCEGNPQRDIHLPNDLHKPVGQPVLRQGSAQDPRVEAHQQLVCSVGYAIGQPGAKPPPGPSPQWKLFVAQSTGTVGIRTGRTAGTLGTTPFLSCNHLQQSMWINRAWSSLCPPAVQKEDAEGCQGPGSAPMGKPRGQSVNWTTNASGLDCWHYDMHGIESRIDNKHGQAWIFKSLWGQRGASRISLSISVWTRQMIDWSIGRWPVDRTPIYWGLKTNWWQVWPCSRLDESLHW